MNKVLFFLSFVFLIFASFTTKANADSVSAWDETTTIPYLSASHVATIYNNHLFVIGGSAATGQSKFSVLSSSINPDGTLSAWTSTSSALPSALIFHSIAQYNNYIYILGGKEENPGSSMSIVRTVYFAHVDNNRLINSWNTTTQLPYPMALGAAAVVGDKIYISGGCDDNACSSFHNQVYFTTINSTDGTLSSWTLAGTLPEPLTGHGLIADGNRLTLIGGATTGPATENKVYQTTVQNDGTIISWTTAPPLPAPDYRGGYLKVGSQIFVVGGTTSLIGGLTNTDTVYYTNIIQNGFLDTWQTSSNHLPLTSCCGSLTSANGYLYWIGGYTFDHYLDTVYFANIQNTTVPFFSQKAAPWGNTEYDHAQSLGFSPSTMTRWGCAVTSTAMVLNGYGITKLPDGTSLDPGSLNTWLNNNNGYITGSDSGGKYSYLDWTVIPKLASQIRAASQSATDVMVQVVHPADYTSLLASDSAQQMADILQVHSDSTSSHFVVVTGQKGDTFSINDPYWEVPDLTGYDSSYDEAVRLIPSHTDLSYITLVVDPTVNILLTDSHGNKVGNDGTQTFNDISNALYGQEQPIGDPIDPSQTLGVGVNRLLLPLPTTDTYHISLTSHTNQTYTLHILTMQTDGTNQDQKVIGSIGQGTTKDITLNYSSDQPATTSSTITVYSTLLDLQSLYQAGEIKSLPADAMRLTLQDAAKAYQNGKTLVVKADMDLTIISLKAAHALNLITENAYQVLLNDLQSLASSKTT